MDIVYGSKSRVLKDIRMAKDESYIEDSSSLIDKLNPQKRKPVNIFQKIFGSGSIINTGEKVRKAPVILLCVSIVMSVLMVGLVSYVYYLNCLLTDTLIMSFPRYIRYELDIYVLIPIWVFVGLIITQIIGNLDWREDIYRRFLRRLVYWKKKRSIVVPVRSESHRATYGFSLWCKYIFPHSQPTHQQLLCKILGENTVRRNDNDLMVQLMLTEEKMEIFKVLYNAKKVQRYIPLQDSNTRLHKVFAKDRWGYSNYVKGEHSSIKTGVDFSEGVPIVIEYYKANKELLSIAPLEGYDYTEEQLAAIEKFNTLYP